MTTHFIKHSATSFALSVLCGGFLALPLASLPTPSHAQLMELVNQATQKTESIIPSASASANLEQVPELKSKITQAYQKKTAFLSTESFTAVSQYGVTQQQFDRKKFLVNILPRVYQDHIDRLVHLDKVQKKQLDVKQAIQTWQGFPDPPPYGIDRVDQLRDDVHAIQLKFKALQSEGDILKQDINTLKADLREAQQLERQLASKIEKSTDTATSEQLKWLQKLQQLEIEYNEAQLASSLVEEQTIRTTLDTNKDELTLAKKKLLEAAQSSPLHKQELDKKLARLGQEQRQVAQELESAIVADRQAQQNLDVSRTHLNQLRSQLVEQNRSATTAEKHQLAGLEAAYELNQALAETSSIKLENLRMTQTLLEYEQLTWRARYRLAHEGMSNEIAQSYKRVKEGLSKIDQLEPYFQSNLQLVQAMLVQQQQTLASGHAQNAGVSSQLVNTYKQRGDSYRRILSKLQELDWLLERFYDETNEEEGSLPLAQQAQNKLEQAGYWLNNIWSFELFTVSEPVVMDGHVVNSEKGVTVKSIFLALVIIILGFFVTRFLTRRLTYLALKKFRWHPNRSILIDKWLFYALVGTFIFVGMSAADIPMTIFAFLGGALAIGAGFGAQNLINNFISGIILLIERPIKLGDIIDVGDVRGQIEKIGARCSLVRRFDGIEMLIPNADFLEKNVINWTLSDNRVRTFLDVGVAYGSDTQLVRTIMLETAENHPRVLPHPEPFVLFDNFGDNSLNFRLYYWVNVEVEMDLYRVASDFRYEIDRRFRESGVVIAFPQSDVHLTVTQPVKVDLSGATASLGKSLATADR